MKRLIFQILLSSVLFIKCSDDSKLKDQFKNSFKEEVPNNHRVLVDSVEEVSPEYSTGDYHLKYANEKLLDSLKQKIKWHDTEAFSELLMIYGLTGHSDEFLKYAMYYGSAHNNQIACHTVYQILRDYEDEDLEFLANVYLLKSYKLGRKKSESEMNRFNDSTMTLEKYVRENAFKLK
jgi:hypothetical protein